MTGILFIARLGSTRLSQKHLIKANGKTFIEWLLLRFAAQFEHEIRNGSVKLIVTTSDEPENRLFESVLADYHIDIFYGSKENIPLRQLECAEAYGLTEIISVDGDDILCSPFAGRAVLEKLKVEETIVKTSGLPIGLNVWGYQTAILSDALKQFSSASRKLETGWGRIFDGLPVFDIKYNEAITGLRFTLDYPADADFFSSIINHLGEKVVSIKDADLIQFVQKHSYQDLNKDMETQYFENFYNQKQSE